MIFQIEPDKITKELLLSKYSQETYMEHYLGFKIHKGLYKSPLRSDPNPTCSFYKNKSGELYFHDFRGDFHGNFISVVMEINSCSYYLALQIIANDFGIINKSNLTRSIPKNFNADVFEQSSDTSIEVKIKKFSEKELKYWESFGISENTLKLYKVFSCENIYLNNNYFCSSSENNPIYGYFGGIRDNLKLWRIYFPNKSKYRFLSNWKKNIIQGIKQLPNNSNYIVITKSLKDVMCLYELGIPAIAPCSESMFLSKIQYDKIKAKYNNIILLYDNDLAGIKSMNKIRKEFNLIVTYIPRKYKVKDISDFYKKYGLMESLNIISNFLKEYNL